MWTWGGGWEGAWAANQKDVNNFPEFIKFNLVNLEEQEQDDEEE